VYAEVDDPDDDVVPGWARSVDGGRTWHHSKRPRNLIVNEYGNAPRVSEACRSDGTCVRLDARSIEERVDGGRWETAFAYSSDDIALMDYRSTEPELRDVVVVRALGEETVVAAAGEDGVVVAGGDGVWERLGVLEVEPADLSGTMRLLDAVPWAFLAPLAGVVFVLLDAMGLPTERHQRVSAGALVAALLMAMTLGLLAAIVWGFGVLSVADPVAHGLVVLGIVAASVGLPWAYLRDGRRAGRWNIAP